MNTSRRLTILRRSLPAAFVFAVTASSVFAQAPATTATGTTAPTGAAGADKPKPLTPADKKFVKDTFKSLYFELQLAQIAKGQATSDATKKFAELVNNEQNKAWEGLAEIAKAKNEPVPAELTGGDKGTIDRLKKTKGDAFDKFFFREILKEAKGVDRDFVSEAKSGADPDLKNFATQYLAVVKGHVTEGEKAEKESTKKP